MRTIRSAVILVFFWGIVEIQSTSAQDDVGAQINALREQIETLDEKVRALERKQAAEPNTATASSKAPVLSAGEHGVQLQSADGNFRARIGGYLQADGRFYFQDHSAANDGFLIRRARPIIEGTVFKDFDFRIMPDFAGSAVTLEDAYLNWKLRPEVQIQAGKFTAPVGLERLQSSTVLAFPERGYPTSLVPNRDIGVELHGTVFDTLEYALGIFNGAPDGASVVMDSDNGEDVEGRLFARPFVSMTNSLLNGVGFGVAGTYGQHRNAPASYKTIGQQTFFSWANGVSENGTTWRVAPQATYYAGPFGLLGEYTEVSHDVRSAAARAELRNSAWQVIAIWALTGEKESFRGLDPNRRFDPAAGGWGALELALRYSGLDIDNAAFPAFANPATSASAANTFGVGLNWYLNANVRLSTDYSLTHFDGGNQGAVTKQDEQVVISRVQISF